MLKVIYLFIFWKIYRPIPHVWCVFVLKLMSYRIAFVKAEVPTRLISSGEQKTVQAFIFDCWHLVFGYECTWLYHTIIYSEMYFIQYYPIRTPSTAEISSPLTRDYDTTLWEFKCYHSPGELSLHTYWG